MCARIPFSTLYVISLHDLRSHKWTYCLKLLITYYLIFVHNLPLLF